VGLLTERLLFDSTVKVIREESERGFEKTASEAIIENNEKMKKVAQYDFFICHAKVDGNLILGLIRLLKEKGYSAYVDWIDDPLLDRTNVTPKTAKVLKQRIRASRCLLYAFTENSEHSKWMPWELGIKDGHNGKVLITPITKQLVSTYSGQEYLGLYPYLTVFGSKEYPNLNYFELQNIDGTKPSLHDWMNR